MKKILRPFYNYFVKLAKSPYAIAFLSIYAILEAIVFPFPNEIFLIPLCLYAPKKIYKIVFLTSLFSIIGGVLAYFIGYYFYDVIGMQIIGALGLEKQMLSIESLYDKIGSSLIFIGGFTPFPFKIIAIFSGFVKSPFWIYLILVAISRTLRYFIIGWLLKKYGEEARKFIEKRLEIILIVLTALVVAVFLLLGI